MGDDSSVDELIASTGRGRLVTRFRFMRVVDPRAILYTGPTRDGTFLIEDGRVTGAARNLRWNESPMNGVANRDPLGRAERVVWSEGVKGPSRRR